VQKSFRNGKDVDDSLIRKMEKKDMLKKMPRRMISQETDTNKKAIEQEVSILCKAEIDIYTTRTNELKDNMNKTFSLIFLQKHWNMTIQDRITAHLEFKSKINNDPFKVLKAVKILNTDPVRARYLYASVTEAMTRFMTCRQLENKSLADYVMVQRKPRQPGTKHGKGFPDGLHEEHKAIQGQNWRWQKMRYRKGIIGAMDSVYADEEQWPREIWFADDKSDNSVLYGNKSVPKRRLVSHQHINKALIQQVSASQALQRSTKSETKKEWMNLNIKKEIFTTTENSGHQVQRRTASYWIMDPRWACLATWTWWQTKESQRVLYKQQQMQEQTQPSKLLAYLDLVWWGMTKPQLQIYLAYQIWWRSTESHLTLDSEKEDAFTVHMDSETFPINIFKKMKSKAATKKPKKTN
jgi:hypothetical protein